MSNFFKHFILPTSILVAAIIGAGIFSLPFAFHAIGLPMTMTYLIAFGILAAYVHLIYADIVAHADAKHHHFPGYAKLYLGNRFGNFATFVVLCTLLLTLTAYLILSTSFLHILLPALPPLTLLIIFWTLGTIFSLITIRGTALFNTITAGITLVAIAAIFYYWAVLSSLNIAPFRPFTPSEALSPFGPILFSVLGLFAIPSTVSYARKAKLSPKETRRVLVFGSVIPVFFYLLFIIAIWGLSPFVSTDSISGLAASLPAPIIFTIGILGFVSLWDSYTSIARDAGSLIRSEFSLPSLINFILIATSPLILFFIGFQNFITVISIIGGILLSIWGVLIILTWEKALSSHSPSIKFSTRKIPMDTKQAPTHIPFFIPYILLAVFAGGILYELVRFESSF